VGHVFLNAEVVDRDAKVQCSCHGDRGQVSRTVASSAYVVERREVGDFFHGSQAAPVHNRHPDIVNPLLTDEIVSLPDGVEHFASGDRCSRVLANEPESFLQLCRNRIFHPEEMKRLQLFSQTRSFDWRQSVVTIMQEMDVLAASLADSLKQLWRVS